MNNKTYLILIALILVSLEVMGGKYYWVGNGGNWDELSHWATASNGSVLHAALPGASDSVYFDAYSFNQSGEMVFLDNLLGVCAMMDWSGIDDHVEFNAWNYSTLQVHGSCLLSDLLVFAFPGTLEILAQAPAFAELDFSGLSLSCNLLLAADSVFLSSKLSLPYHQLYVVDGTLYTQSHEVECLNFNTDSGLMNSIDVLSPKWIGDAALTVNGSLALAESFDFQQTGPIFFYCNSVDSNYITAGSALINARIVYAGGRKLLLNSPLAVSGTIEINGNGMFFTQGFPISALALISKTSLDRVIDLDTSTVLLSGHGTPLSLFPHGLSLHANQASIHFTYTGSQAIHLNTAEDGIYSFKEIHLPPASVMVHQSFTTSWLSLGASTALALARGTRITLDSLHAAGDCGHYVYLRAFCPDCPFCLDENDCDLPRPVMDCQEPIVAAYLKIRNIKAEGSAFVANNSFNEGNNEGFTFLEPSSPPVLYWINGSGQWNDPAHWAAESGGLPGECIPTRHTRVVFDAASSISNDTVFVNGLAYCKTMTWTGLAAAGYLLGNGTLMLSGNLQLHALTHIALSGGMILANAGTEAATITSNASTVQCDISLETQAAWELADNLVVQGKISLLEGEFKLKGFSLNCHALLAGGSKQRKLDYSGSLITLTGHDTVWRSSGTNLDLLHGSASLRLLGDGINYMLLDAGGRTFDTLDIRSLKARIAGGANCKLIRVMAGGLLEGEPLSTIHFDTLYLPATCLEPVCLSGYQNAADPVVLSWNAVNDSLFVSNVILRNVIADTTGKRKYVALGASALNQVEGWIFRDSVPGRKLYWTGQSSQSWHDLANWETAGGGFAVCLPGLQDTVVFDFAHLSAAGSRDTVLLGKNAYCAGMIWGNDVQGKPALLLGADLYVTDSLVLCDSLTLAYTAAFHPTLPDAPAVVLAPRSGVLEFNPRCKGFLVNLSVQGKNLLGRVELLDDFTGGNRCSLGFFSGTFQSNGKNLAADFIFSASSAPKLVNFEHSTLTAGYSFLMQDASVLAMEMASSKLIMKDNVYNLNFFDGGNQTYHEVEFRAKKSSFSPDDYTTIVEGSNSFHAVSLEPGLHLQLEAGSVQTVGEWHAEGNCSDSIFLVSSSPGLPATIKKLSGDSIRGSCLDITDIVIDGAGGAAMFSRGAGNTSGWLINSAKRTVASFLLPATTCLYDTLHFINTSQKYPASTLDLSCAWSFGDGTFSTLFHPAHHYLNPGTFMLSLAVTDTITGCKDVYNDTIAVHSPFVYLSASEPDASICQGTQLTFSAHSSNPSPQYQFVLSGIPLGQSPDSSHFTTTELVNGDEIYAVITYQGCMDTSDVLVFAVHGLPTVQLSSSIPEYAVCQGDSVIFTAGGADYYQLFLNGTAATAFSADTQWVISTLNHGDQLSLYGEYSTTGCGNFAGGIPAMTVHALPVPSLTCSEPDLTICSGTPLTFLAAGANQYQFFQNATPLGPVSASASITVSTLAQGDIVSVKGLTEDGCVAFSNDNLVFTVFPTPLVQLVGSAPGNTICKGEPVSFLASGADEYQFMLDGDTLGPYNYSSSYLTDTLEHGQTITVKGKLGVCESQVSNAIVMNVRPSITWLASASEICPQDTLVLTARGDSVYHFFIDGMMVQSGPDSVFKVSGLSSGQMLSVAGTEGACLPVPLQIIVHPLVQPLMSCSDPDTTICLGDAITFTGSGALLYAFFVDGVLVQDFSPLASFNSNILADGQRVTMQALSAFGCLGTSADTFSITAWPYPEVSLWQSDPDLTICTGDTVTFLASGADNYQFFVNGLAQGMPGPGNSFLTATLVDGATVMVKGSSDYCTASSAETYTYTVYPLPIVTLNAITPLDYCYGDTLTLLAGGASQYEFFVDGVSVGLPSGNSVFSSTTLTNGQTVSVTGYQNDCAAPGNNTYTVTINNYPDIIFSSDLPANGICYGDTIVFEGNGAQAYRYFLDGIPVSQDSIYQAIGLEQGQTISLHGGNGACWVVADTVYTVLVNYLPLEITCAQPAAVFCEGSPITFNATGADLYEFFVDANSQGAPSALGSFTSAALANGQVVAVEGTSLTSTCVQLAIGDILVHALPVPQIAISPAPEFCQGDSVLLLCNQANGLTWYHDGGAVAGASSPELYVLTGGYYTVQAGTGTEIGVLSCGANHFGQLGDGTNANSLIFKTAAGLGPITSVACGSHFSLAVAANGLIKAWGENEFGGLGNGTFTDSPWPVNVGNITNAALVAAGSRFGLALLGDSTLRSWGDNTFGQLGYGNYATSNFPFPVQGLTKVIDVAAGDNHCLAVTSDGKAWAWGRNHYGQLGDSTLVSSNLPVQVKGLANVIAVRAGGNHSMALTADGSLWIWGANNAGQLGNGAYTASLVPVRVNIPLPLASFDAGFAHSIAADTAGHVYCWGDNLFGQLGHQSPSQAVYPLRVPKAGKAKIARAGAYSSFAIRSDENVFSWGLNNHGQLGQQHANPVFEPAVALPLFGVQDMDGGYMHCAAITNLEFACSAVPAWIQMDTIPDIFLVLNGLTLSTTAQGINYQWYYEGNPIPAANSNAITVGAEGVYKVQVVFANNCSGFSSDYGFYVGMEDLARHSGCLIYPNPNDGSFTVFFPVLTQVPPGQGTLKVLDVCGRCLWQQPVVQPVNHISLGLDGLPQAVYTLEFSVGMQLMERKRFVVAY